MQNLQLIINTKSQEADEMFELAVTDGKDYIGDYINLDLVKHLKEWKKVALLSRVVDSIDTNEKELENIAKDGGLLTWDCGNGDTDDWQSDEYLEVATVLNSLYEARKAIIIAFAAEYLVNNMPKELELAYNLSSDVWHFLKAKELIKK